MFYHLWDLSNLIFFFLQHAIISFNKLIFNFFNSTLLSPLSHVKLSSLSFLSLVFSLSLPSHLYYFNKLCVKLKDMTLSIIKWCVKIDKISFWYVKIVFRTSYTNILMLCFRDWTSNHEPKTITFPHMNKEAQCNNSDN